VHASATTDRPEIICDRLLGPHYRIILRFHEVGRAQNWYPEAHLIYIEEHQLLLVQQLGGEANVSLFAVRDRGGYAASC
jgi:hypothetical protein